MEVRKVADSDFYEFGLIAGWPHITENLVNFERNYFF